MLQRHPDNEERRDNIDTNVPIPLVNERFYTFQMCVNYSNGLQTTPWSSLRYLQPNYVWAVSLPVTGWEFICQQENKQTCYTELLAYTNNAAEHICKHKYKETDERTYDVRVAVDSLTILRINFSSSRAPPLRSLAFDLKYPRRQLGRICDRLEFWYIACNEILIYGNLERTLLWNSSPLRSALPSRLVANSAAAVFHRTEWTVLHCFPLPLVNSPFEEERCG